MHIADVRKGLEFFKRMLDGAAERHDFDKLTDIDRFHRDFLTGFETTEWWEDHKILNRHHLNDHVPDDVNLIDVVEMIVDCVMAGMARSGSVYEITIDCDVLSKAVRNTFELLQEEIQVEP